MISYKKHMPGTDYCVTSKLDTTYKTCCYKNHFCPQSCGSLLNTFCYPAHAYMFRSITVQVFPLYVHVAINAKKRKEHLNCKNLLVFPCLLPMVECMYKFLGLRRLFQRNVIFHSFHICNFISTTMNHSSRFGRTAQRKGCKIYFQSLTDNHLSLNETTSPKTSHPSHIEQHIQYTPTNKLGP